LEGGALLAGFLAQVSNWRGFYWAIFSYITTSPDWSHAILFLIFIYFPIFVIRLS